MVGFGVFYIITSLETRDLLDVLTNRWFISKALLCKLTRVISHQSEKLFRLIVMSLTSEARPPQTQ